MKNWTHWIGRLGAVLCLLGAVSASAQTLLIEAEGLQDLGGWTLDSQAMDVMGSPYLLAHGMGRPVDDAQGEFEVPADKTYAVHVRTRDWVATWGAPGAPGRFQILIDGKPLDETFGTKGADWHWHSGGTLDLKAGRHTIAIHDLTGFEGRCDAIVLTAEPGFVPPASGDSLAQWRRKILKQEGRVEDAAAAVGIDQFDLVVIGGGMAGSCAAISAARLGQKVALIQNRPVLGGNNSSEVRVHLGGNVNQPPYPRLGDVVAELDPGKQGNAKPAENYNDGRKLAVVRGEKNITLYLSTHAWAVEQDGDRITAVLARDLRSGREWRFRAPLFADCTGDGTIGYLAGADFRVGREGRDETNESRAPEQADQLVMGASVQWYSVDAGEPTAFPDLPWALPFTEETCQKTMSGEWDWEAGLDRDQILDVERVKDRLYRAIYGNWAFQKNHSRDKAKYANRRLGWVAAISGKRESRRLLGDHILCEQDIAENRAFPDAFVTATWSVDLHFPHPKNEEQFPGHSFRSIYIPTHTAPYTFPYRCLYSRNIENLFMAGRDISVTHVALGKVRVMRTCGMMGEVVGMAASVANREKTNPRGVYENHLEKLKALVVKGVGKD